MTLENYPLCFIFFLILIDFLDYSSPSHPPSLLSILLDSHPPFKNQFPWLRPNGSVTREEGKEREMEGDEYRGREIEGEERESGGGRIVPNQMTKYVNIIPIHFLSRLHSPPPSDDEIQICMTKWTYISGPPHFQLYKNL